MEYKLTFEQYQQGLNSGKLLGLKCESCNAYTFPAQGVCGDCGGKDLEVAEMKREGTIKTFTVIRVAPEGMRPPYIVAMVQLAEGPWITGNVVDTNPDEADLSLIGRNVRVGSQPYEGVANSEAALSVPTFTLI